MSRVLLALCVLIAFAAVAFASCDSSQKTQCLQNNPCGYGNDIGCDCFARMLSCLKVAGCDGDASYSQWADTCNKYGNCTKQQCSDASSISFSLFAGVTALAMAAYNMF